MGEHSKIEWTDASWTPIRARNLVNGRSGWHCEHVTTGCEHCYSEGLNKRLGTGLPFKPGHRKDVDLFLDEKMLLAPLRWKRPRMIFVCSMTDLFADFVTDAWIDRVFAVMALCRQHTFQVLTKRSARMRSYLSQFRLEGRYVVSDHPTSTDPRDGNCFLLLNDDQTWPLPNVWLGVSAEDQTRADERVPDLLATPAAMRFVSAEPLLGRVDFTRLNHERDRGWEEPMNSLEAYTLVQARKDWGEDCEQTADRPRLDWIIAGGESGSYARPMHPQWARDIRDQCATAGVPFFFKQFGHWREPRAGEPFDTSKGRIASPPAFIVSRNGTVHCFENFAGPGAVTMLGVGKTRAGRLLDGVEHSGMPEAQS